MLLRYRRYLIAAGTLLALLLIMVSANASNSYAWFVTSSKVTTQKALGNLEIGLDYESEARDGNSLTLENTGNVPTYVRLGYTFVYRDRDGNDLMKDVSGLALDKVTASLTNGELSAAHTQIFTETGYGKPFLVLCDNQKENHYYQLMPGETVTVDYQIAGVDEDDGQVLHVLWSAEAVQASAKALNDGAAYGWDMYEG